ncbi:MAG TPA: GHMP kinase [Verrucomicrobiae bacterium]|jgi:D-glycero-alpha-D-manno-heptose-7-phosphate kinase
MANLAANLPRIVVTRTPLRVSFAGGGTDLADYYERDYGAVFSAAIDKYIHVTVKRHSELFNEPIRINYSITEMVENVDAIQNNIARECLRLLRVDPPIYISTVGDLPASTGLAGSSCFAVGLLNALHAYKGERVSPGQLAEEATHIEINVLKEPIGKQDQYAAAFGGLNFFRFNPGGAVTIEPARPNGTFIADLFSHVQMFWTGLQRNASSVLSEQKTNIPDKLGFLNKMRDQAHQLRTTAETEKFSAEAFGSILHESWLLKRQLASSISSSKIDEYYELARRAGAEGGKICGAGNGGFLLFIVKPDKKAAVRDALSKLLEVPIHFEAHGSKVLLPFEQ